MVSAERPVAVLRRGSGAWLVTERGRVLRRLDNPAPWALPRIWVADTPVPGEGALLTDEAALEPAVARGRLLAANRRVPGMALTALGAALNLLAITANGGVMPASPAALAAAGLPVDEAGFQSSTAVDGPQLAFLGDVFAIPASWPLSNVFSVGDVLIGVGLAWGMHRICGSRLVPRWRGRPGLT